MVENVGIAGFLNELFKHQFSMLVVMRVLLVGVKGVIIGDELFANFERHASDYGTELDHGFVHKTGVEVRTKEVEAW